MVERALSITHHVAWLFFVAYWVWNAHGIKAPVRTQARWLRLVAYWLPLALAVVLLGPCEWFGDCPLRERFVPKHIAVKWIGLAMTVAGIAFACWARHLLGRNWSSEVQIKQDHQLIQAGPYRTLRHPIYTGLLLAFLGTALKVGDWRGLLAVALVAGSFWFKLRQEERWLLERFGAPYADYMRHTRALIPGVL